MKTWQRAIAVATASVVLNDGDQRAGFAKQAVERFFMQFGEVPYL